MFVTNITILLLLSMAKVDILIIFIIVVIISIVVVSFLLHLSIVLSVYSYTQVMPNNYDDYQYCYVIHLNILNK